MKQHEKELLLARVEAGYLRYRQGDLVLKICPPTADMLYEANEIYYEVCENEIWNSSFSEEDLIQYMFQNGFWSEDMEKEYHKLPDVIENLKIGLYDNIFRELESKQIRKFLAETKEEYGKLSEKRHSLDHLTLNGVALLVKTQHVTQNSTFYMDGRLYDWNEVGVLDILHYQQANAVTESQIRELAADRNSPLQYLFLSFDSSLSSNHARRPLLWDVR